MEIQVQVTTPDKATAMLITKKVVEQRLAACAQIVGAITSTYWWQGEVETGEEWLCLFKTTTEKYEALEAQIVQLHPYTVPQIVAVELSHALPQYRAWVQQETKS